MPSNNSNSEMRNKSNCKDYKIVILFGLFIASLCVGYVLVLSPMYSYSHLTFNPKSTKLLISVFLILVSLFFLPSDSEKPSTYLYFIFYSTTYIPTATYYWLNDQPTTYIVYETICLILISIVIKRKAMTIQIRTYRAKGIIQILLVVYVLSCIYLLFHNGGIHLTAILKDLYLVRSKNNISGLPGYLLNWCAKSFMPLFFAYFYIKRNRFGVVLTCLLQALLFVSYGFKAFLMAIILLIGVSFLMKKPERFNRRWLYVYIVGNVVCTLLAQVLTPKFINLFTYRTLFLPAQGQFEYYDFFTNHSFLYFSEGSIGKLLGIQYPYTESIGYVVNLYIFEGQKISNGNTGALSYGFADFGFVGMLLAAVIIGLILRFVDASTKKLPKAIPVCALVYQIFSLNDTNVLIGLNTGGILGTLIMLMLLNSAYSHFFEERFDEALEEREKRYYGENLLFGKNTI